MCVAWVCVHGLLLHFEVFWHLVGRGLLSQRQMAVAELIEVLFEVKEAQSADFGLLRRYELQLGLKAGFSWLYGWVVGLGLDH